MTHRPDLLCAERRRTCAQMPSMDVLMEEIRMRAGEFVAMRRQPRKRRQDQPPPPPGGRR